MLEEIPIVVFAYDLLEFEGEDYRDKPLMERRKKLEELLQNNPSEKITFLRSSIMETGISFPQSGKNPVKSIAKA
jgi:DNA ligase-1